MFTFFGWGDQNGREIVCGSQSRLIMYSWEGFKDIRYMTWNVSKLDND